MRGPLLGQIPVSGAFGGVRYFKCSSTTGRLPNPLPALAGAVVADVPKHFGVHRLPAVLFHVKLGLVTRGDEAEQQDTTRDANKATTPLSFSFSFSSFFPPFPHLFPPFPPFFFFSNLVISWPPTPTMSRGWLLVYGGGLFYKFRFVDINVFYKTLWMGQMFFIKYYGRVNRFYKTLLMSDCASKF